MGWQNFNNIIGRLLVPIIALHFSIANDKDKSKKNYCSITPRADYYLRISLVKHCCQIPNFFYQDLFLGLSKISLVDICLHIS